MLVALLLACSDGMEIGGDSGGDGVAEHGGDTATGDSAGGADAGEAADVSASGTGPLLINEVYPSPDEDWIELHNTGAAAVDLSTATFEDGNGDVLDLSAYGTLGAGGFVRVDLVSPYKLKNEGETIALSLGGTAADVVTFPAVDDPGLSVARVPDGGAAWAFATPTPGASNGQ